MSECSMGCPCAPSSDSRRKSGDELTPFIPRTTLAFYGLVRVQLINITRIGDTSHVQTEVLDEKLRDKAASGVTTEMIVKNHLGEDAAAGIMKTLVAREER